MQFKNNNNKYYILFIILLVLATIFFFSNQDSTLNKKYTDFAFKDTATLSSIIIKDSARKLELFRARQSWITDNNIPIKNRTILLMLKIFSQLSIKSPISKDKQAEIRKDFETKAVQVSFMNNDKVLKRFYLYDYPENNETFMSIDHASHIYLMDVPYLQGKLMALLVPDINFWRDNVIFRDLPDDISSLSVEFPSNLGKSFKLTRLNNGILTLTDLNDLQTFPINDKKTTLEYLSSFSNVVYEKVVAGVPRHSSDSIRSSKPLYIISLKDKNNKLTVMKGFPISIPNLKNEAGRQLNYDPDRLFVFINNDTELVVAKYINIDPISRNIDYFLTK